MSSASSLASLSHGFGLGLRTPHYQDFLTAPQSVDWLEIITDNYLVEGGKPLVMLDKIRRDYPMAMHGVAMSIGAANGVDLSYLQQVKRLADRIEPLWVSDHLCWIGNEREQLHDLYPLPYTDEAARQVITQIKRAQDVLQRRLVIENVSSYIDYKQSTASEWEFLSHVANEADCLLLVDVNNIYVSSVNHHFDPLDYLRALPAKRVQQIHLAGHTVNDNHIVDTHDHPVAEPVWALYAEACQLFLDVPAMIERDAHIPELPVLIDELNRARNIANRQTTTVAVKQTAAPKLLVADQPHLAYIQSQITDFVLSRSPSADAVKLVREQAQVDPLQRLNIYYHAYRARLIEVLADSFAKTALFMGSDLFDRQAAIFAVQQPPSQRSLNRYGAGFPDFLSTQYPQNPELEELARLDWDLRACFDGPDVSALGADRAQADRQSAWLDRPNPLHPSVVLRETRSNVVSIWRAIDADEAVPELTLYDKPSHLIVWRKGLSPHFQTLSSEQAAFLELLQSDRSINSVCAKLVVADQLPLAETLGSWMREWLAEGLLRAD